MASKRVTILSPAGERKLVNIPSGITFEQFKAIASEKLKITAHGVFTASGVEVDDIDALRDDDVLTITEKPKGDKNKKVAAGPQQIKIAVIGPGGVGKSAITLQYVQGRFVVEYDPTIEDAYRKRVVIDAETCSLDILDTAGQEDYIALRGQWMQERQGFVLVYSVTERRTFEDLRSFYNQLLQIHDNKCPPLVMLANKSDAPEDQKKVTKTEGQDLAKTFDNAIFLETSAKTGFNIDLAFTKLVREVRKRQGTVTKRAGCVIL